MRDVVCGRRRDSGRAKHDPHAYVIDAIQVAGDFGDWGCHSVAHTLALLPIILPTPSWVRRAESDRWG